jgi:hypothetical protein
MKKSSMLKAIPLFTGLWHTAYYHWKATVYKLEVNANDKKEE